MHNHSFANEAIAGSVFRD